MPRSLLMAILLYVLPACANAALDLDVWDRLLGVAVSAGQVDYSQWANNPEFDLLVEQIENADTSTMDTRQALVFYINAYNILAAKGILNGHSPSTLWGRYNYFKRDKYTIAGSKINLYDLEHELIRPLQEPRIHFAIVCASQSCPILRSEAYVLARLDEQLDDAARGFINDPSRNRFDLQTNTVELSRIFKWFKQDFTDATGSVPAYIAQYADNSDARALLLGDELRLDYLPYDWDLNGSQ
jgi:hypothetical protein